MDDGWWMMDGGWDLNPSEQGLRLYFNHFTDLQPKNAASPTFTLFSELSITISRLRQYRKAHSPMLVTLSGMFMLVKLLHPLKAQFPMLVTPFGILMLIKLSHP